MVTSPRKENSRTITNRKGNSKFNDLIFILNPNSQGGNTGKNWDETYSKIKKYLPIKHQIMFTKKSNDPFNSFSNKVCVSMRSQLMDSLKGVPPVCLNQ